METSIAVPKISCFIYPTGKRLNGAPATYTSRDNIPEAVLCRELGIKIVDGLGAKIQSSSELTGIKEIK